MPKLPSLRSGAFQDKKHYLQKWKEVQGALDQRGSQQPLS